MAPNIMKRKSNKTQIKPIKKIGLTDKKKSIPKRKTKLGSALELIKPQENPIIGPKAENEWEAWQTFNPGVVLLNNKVHFLYRAIGEDGISRLGYAVSSDGFHIDERLPYPAYEHKTKSGERAFNIYSLFSGGSFGGAEDPRIVRCKK